jgi:hypothetical protein
VHSSVFKKLNNRCSPSTGLAFVPRRPVHGRQTPAKNFAYTIRSEAEFRNEKHIFSNFSALVGDTISRYRDHVA